MSIIKVNSLDDKKGPDRRAPDYPLQPPFIPYYPPDTAPSPALHASSAHHEFFKLCCEHCGKTFNVPVYCGNRFCKVCSVRRNNRVRNRLKFLVDNCDRPRKYRFKFLTLTISNQPDLTGMIKSITKSFRRLRSRQYWKNNVDGGAYVLEIKGNPGNWHVHLHIVMMSRFMSFEMLLKIWRKVSEGRGVWIIDVPAAAVVCYLTKYMTKPDVSNISLTEINREMRNVRLFSPFGSWHALNRTYIPPVSLCPDCGKTDFYPFDLMFGDYPKSFFLEVQLSRS